MYADKLTASSELFVETPVFFHSLLVLLLLYLTKRSKYKKKKEHYLGTTRKRTQSIFKIAKYFQRELFICFPKRIFPAMREEITANLISAS